MYRRCAVELLKTDRLRNAKAPKVQWECPLLYSDTLDLRKETNVPFPFFISQIGSFVLGITFGFAILFHVGSSRTKVNSAEGCFGVIVCTLGAVLTLICYVAAINAFGGV